MSGVRAAGLCLALATATCSAPRSLPPCVEAAPSVGPEIDAGVDPVVLAAGDIVAPGHLEGAYATSELLDRLDGQVLVLGDASQRNGSIDELVDAYGPTWGRHRWRTRPVPGNHDYRTPNAGPYFAYFCAAAGAPYEGYYSFDVGAWHVIGLNSSCSDRDSDGPSCASGSKQERWLKADLAAHPARCTLAYWHHPRFTYDDAPMADVWRTLYEAGADLVLNGHMHVYERFAPQSPDGLVDTVRGIREIIVGTGGAPLDALGPSPPNSEVRVTGRWGVLRLTLRPTEYAWAFVGVDGRIEDEGTSPCH